MMTRIVVDKTLYYNPSYSRILIAYNLLEDRRAIDVIVTKFFPSAVVLKWRNVLRIRITFYVTGQKIRYMKLLHFV